MDAATTQRTGKRVEFLELFFDLVFVFAIALGEAVIAAGATAADVGLTTPVAALLVAGFATAAAMWWCYFDWIHPATERQLVGEPDPRRRSHLARDLFTLGHLPIVAGIVVFAAAVEEGLLHPTDELNLFGMLALAVGTGLYLMGFLIGNLRATGQLLTERLVGLIAVTTWVVLAGPRAPATITVAGVALIMSDIAIVETKRRYVSA